MNAISLEQLCRGEDARVRLLTLMKTLDATYIPPISSVTDIVKYCNKLIRYAEVVVIKQAGDDLGFVAVYANDHVNRCAFVSSIGIKPEFRGHGIGVLLLNQAIEVARQKGMERIRLEVNLKNHAALSFYHKYGFKDFFPYDQSQPKSAIFLEKII